MSSPNINILLNPIPEVRAALSSNAFGISSSRIIEETSFPITAEDVESVKRESSSSGVTSTRVVGRMQIRLLSEEGTIGVKLDRSGWTLESADESSSMRAKIDTTYESLETLLIDISPAYVKAMNDEIWKRFGIEKGDSGDHVEDVAAQTGHTQETDI
ncbi:uncharacterized protein I303_105326 [Kwoniella dejecticola CBS 10117]|uniref:GSKIP domain-containing protein n=1 Tax=Kwoniella dejecticola CBS 10117 TaxID=1296121 RepID=A0A1A6A2U0_9TREE|nr:uncharacterized protein I303_05227 [Kwoniella dejecticola CBS 10117]OBR84369.1 hypothetical protein I303_05227 [Kwoniella dejecticola CBS 10117]